MKGERINFGRLKENLQIPDLISIQTDSYRDFLQKDVIPSKRKYQGLQREFMDIFPPRSENNRNAFGIEFVKYEVVPNNEDLQEILKTGDKYSARLMVTFRMRGASAKDIREETLRMCDIPLMTPSGSFIINGAERVIVSQLHRSPGVCFESFRHTSGKTLWSYKIIADHGSWLEVQYDVKDLMHIYLDRKRRRRKFLISTFMRAFGFDSDEALLDAVYGLQKKDVKKLLGSGDETAYLHLTAAVDVKAPDDPETVLLPALEHLNQGNLEELAAAGVDKIVVVDTEKLGDSFIKCLQADDTVTCEDAQREIYHRMHPSEPVNAEIARNLFEKLFLDDRRYDLGLVGRYKMNQSLGINVDPNVRVLTRDDIAAATARLMQLANDPRSKSDDIDHLSRRRIRTIGELLQNVCRVGLSHVATLARERMRKQANDVEAGKTSISKLINCVRFEQRVEEFFQHNQLSQFMDQINCLAELTNKRRLSALGPGGLNRDRAGTEVRDVHSSHYGRICPIETPEGPNIGLISSLALYAKLDDFGFIMTPYYKVANRQIVMKDGEPVLQYLRADDEEIHYIAQANALRDENGRFVNDKVLGRHQGEAGEFDADSIDYIDVSPKQMISAAASVITFLEHDDANRALMGCNMQRQAVPLMRPERPLVGTGTEADIARYSHAIQVALRDGVVAWADGFKVIVTPDGKLPKGKAPSDFKVSMDTPECQVYILYKFLRSNACTLVNQRPLVKTGDSVRKDDPLADGSCTDHGELALGRNVLVAFMSWCGYNYEDAIIISEKLVQDDVYTSVHINLQETEARDNKMGNADQITRDIPNVGFEALSNLDTEGVIRIGAVVKPDDLLVGRVSPKNEGELAPEERLLKAIFGEKASDVRNTSLKTDVGNDGVVYDLRITRKDSGGDSGYNAPNSDDIKARQAETRQQYKSERDGIIDDLVKELGDAYLAQKLPVPIYYYNAESQENAELIPADRKITKLLLNNLAHHYDDYQMKDCEDKVKIDEIIRKYRGKLRDNEQCCKDALELIVRNGGHDMEAIKKVRVYIASKRRISIGDKMAGRHGNKGIVSRIVPVADLPFMADGTPVEIILNPVGVPSRMNIGQVFESHVGWAARILGINVATPAFDGLQESCMVDLLERARLVKVAEAAKVAVPEKIMQTFRKVGIENREAAEVAKAKVELRKLITAAGWTLGERDDKRSTGGKIIDPSGIDRTEEFVDLDGKVRVYDGRTGEPFAQRVMVGQIYMLKLDHLVVNKIHARAVGPYSLVTQQPLGGKAQHGGQRLGEMEVWALEAYGAAYTLQEMLTVKSDDVDGRSAIFKSILAGNNELSAGTPESFNVLMREMMSLCLDVKINHANSNMA